MTATQILISIPQSAIGNYPRWISCDSRPGRNIFRDDGAGAHDGVFADRDAAQDRRIATDARPRFHNCRDHFPVGIALQRAALGRRARILVVDKNDAMANENFVFDGHAFADETVTRDFAVAADARAFLNLNERADARSVADLAAVKIYEVMNFDIAPEFDVGRDHAELSGHEAVTRCREFFDALAGYGDATRAVSAVSSASL